MIIKKIIEMEIKHRETRRRIKAIKKKYRKKQFEITLNHYIMKVCYNYNKKVEQINDLTKEPDNVICNLILKNIKKSFKVECILFISLIVFLFMKNMGIGNINNYYFYLLIIIACLILFNQMILLYRYKEGFYGTNYNEAKELVNFLIQDENKDINHGNGKPIFNEDTKEASISDKSVEYT